MPVLGGGFVIANLLLDAFMKYILLLFHKFCLAQGGFQDVATVCWGRLRVEVIPQVIWPLPPSRPSHTIPNQSHHWDHLNFQIGPSLSLLPTGVTRRDVVMTNFGTVPWYSNEMQECQKSKTNKHSNMTPPFSPSSSSSWSCGHLLRRLSWKKWGYWLVSWLYFDILMREPFYK